MFYNGVLMFSAIERLCINCLRLIAWGPLASEAEGNVERSRAARQAKVCTPRAYPRPPAILNRFKCPNEGLTLPGCAALFYVLRFPPKSDHRRDCCSCSPNQVLTHAARAAAKQLINRWPFQPPLVAARGAREGLWLEQLFMF